MTTVDELLAVVRVHADRVHDAVRRLGAGPDEAVQVVERSAQELVETAAREDVPDPVGWWFARARQLARQLTGTGPDDLPVGSGVLSVDANQARLAEALEARPERERAALLLRDSYDLPATSVGTVLQLDANAAMDVVGAARLAFLPGLLGGPSLSLAGHPVELGALARLAEGGPTAARDATTRRHVQSCERCADAVDAMERARRLLSGLTVVALPDAEREGLLARIETRARAILPVADLDDEEPWEDEHHRPWSWSLITLGLLAAIGIGTGVGVWASHRHDTSPSAQIGAFPLVTPQPVIVVPLTSLSPSPTLTASPLPRVVYLTPSPTPSPTGPPSPTATDTGSPQPITPTLVIDPTTGPNDQILTVTGTNWTPNVFVNISYKHRVGNGVGMQTSVQTDASGAFQTTLQAHDPQAIPGPHDVVAEDGTSTVTVQYVAA